MADSLPERIKMKITIEIDAPSDALEEIPQMIDNAIDGVKFGSASGNGFLLGQKGSYRYTVEDNLPRKPATLETLFGMFDAQLAPGELTSEVRMAADSTTLGHPARAHLDTRSTRTWTPDPRPLGQAVGAQRRRVALLV
uniref:Uncharacterized protein n=1 Tax=Pseudomonas aeruginosa TaxID=287 RepID=A0A2L1KDN6_PSEAI|nr:hypothetical protein [Pseudomonas aeruginosa]AVE20446.1 Hypothetical protein [Pseudomonas aeruginosa]